MSVTDGSASTAIQAWGCPAAELKAQRLVGLIRLALSLAALLTAALASGTLMQPSRGPFLLLVGYFGYAVLVVVLLGISHRPLTVGQVITWSMDFGATSALLVLTHGVASPFFLFIPYLLFTAAVQESERSYVWMTALVLAAFGVLWIVDWTTPVPATEQQHVLMRGVFLALCALLVARWRKYENTRAKDIARLAEWPANLTGRPGFRSALDATLAHAAVVVRADRVLMFWQGEVATSLHLAERRTHGTRLAHYWLPSVHSLVAEPLGEANFFCARLNAVRPVVFLSSAKGIKSWRGRPVDESFRQKFEVEDLLSIYLSGSGFRARLMFLGLAESTSDALLLGQMAGRQIATFLSWLSAEKARLQAESARTRRKIAADLHDGLLQSLTGLSLALEQLHPALSGNLKALMQLDSIQDALAEEQRLLRLLVLNPHGVQTDTQERDFDLVFQLRRTTERLADQFGIRINLSVAPDWPSSLPGNLDREIYLLAHEALLNSLRHSGADRVASRLWVAPDGNFRIDVRDEGQGFDFRGRYKLRDLRDKGWAPKSLARRVSELNGSMTIESTPEGASVEIGIPATTSGDSFGLERPLPSPWPDVEHAH